MDAAAEASVLPRKEEDALREGGEVYTKANTDGVL